MEIQLTKSEIRAILQVCQHRLCLVGSSKHDDKLQSSEDFSTSNDVVLNDSFTIVEEVVNTIDDMKQITQ